MGTYLIIFETANLPTRTLLLGRPNSLYISQHPEIDALRFCGSNYILFFIKYEYKMWQMPECYQLLWYVLASTSLTAGNFLLFFFLWHKQNIVYAMYMLYPELIKYMFCQGNRRTGRIEPVGRWRAAPITPVLSKGALGSECIYLTDQRF